MYTGSISKTYRTWGLFKCSSIIYLLLQDKKRREFGASYKFLWLQKVTEQHQVTTKEVIERTRDILKVGYTNK